MQGMMGGSKKTMLRKKALESMMQGGPSIAVKIEKRMSAPEEAMMGEEGEGEMKEEGMGKEGMESVMLSPEEKEMVMMMRKKKHSMKDMNEGSEGEDKEYA